MKDHAEPRGPARPPEALDEVLARARGAARGRSVDVGTLVSAMGPSAAPAALLLPGLIVMSPISGIPGVSGVGGLVIALIGGQIALGRDEIWLPGWLRRRRVPADRLRAGLDWLRRPARHIDRYIRPRLRLLTGATTRRVFGAIAGLLGLVMPALEFVPFTSSVAASIVSVLALALVVRDGVLAAATVGIGAAAIAGLAWYFV